MSSSATASGLPSRDTAVIEGVLIHGAQGIRSLTVVPLAAAAELGGGSA